MCSIHLKRHFVSGVSLAGWMGALSLVALLVGCGRQTWAPTTAGPNPKFPNTTQGAHGKNVQVNQQKASTAAADSKNGPAAPSNTQDGEDWAMFGRDATRNGVSPESGAPTDWDIESGRNIRWTAPLGSMTHGDPVVVDGFVWVGTNHGGRPDASVLKCFRASDGELLYEYVSPRLPSRINDWPESSLACSPLFEGELMWFTTNRCEVVCLDLSKLRRGEGEPSVLWKLDMIDELGVFPHSTSMGLMHFCSPGSYQDYLYVITGNGVDESHMEVPSPRSPSLICLKKKTGELVWEDRSPGDRILHGQWSSPLVIEIDGRGQVVTAQGDGWLRSFDALTGELIWKFDMNYKKSNWEVGGRGTRNNILSTPVFYENRIYLAGGQDPEHGDGVGRLCCIDPTKRGDVSSEILVDEKGAPVNEDERVAGTPTKNPNSALIWEYGPKAEPETSWEGMMRMVANVAVHKQLVIAPTLDGRTHCLNARTGERLWTYDLLAAIYASPLIVDDKIYLADEDSFISILGLSADPAKAFINTSSGGKDREYDCEAGIRREMNSSIYCSPIFSHGVLYVAARGTLYAISDREKSAEKGASRQRRAGRLLRPRVAYYPTPHDIVEKMIDLAELQPDDVAYDLGSGDGRILIRAAEREGCRSVGYEIDRSLVRESRKEAVTRGVDQLVEIREDDLFEADLRDASVVFTYLQSPRLLELLPKFNRLKPGARIVSHAFPIPGIVPDEKLEVHSSHTNQLHTIYKWTTPMRPTQ